MRTMLALLLVSACTDDARGPGVTSSVDRVTATLPITTPACFAEAVLADACSATLDDEVIPSCDSGRMPCWRIATNCVSVDGGGAGQAFVIDCVVDE